MIKRFCVLVIAVLLVFPVTSLSQVPSEELVRSHYVVLLQKYSSRRMNQDVAETGVTDEDAAQALAIAEATVLDCLMDELEVVALSNNIDRQSFMDALAFAITWKSESEFFQGLNGNMHLGKQVQQCLTVAYESQGIRRKRY